MISGGLIAAADWARGMFKMNLHSRCLSIPFAETVGIRGQNRRPHPAETGTIPVHAGKHILQFDHLAL
jgi:hypothetical protein